jgi:hypothetical protein
MPSEMEACLYPAVLLKIKTFMGFSKSFFFCEKAELPAARKKASNKISCFIFSVFN